MLYDPAAFEPLTRKRWNEARVRDAISRIVAGTDTAYRGDRLMWKPHAWDCWHGTSPMKNLYTGCAGVVWALDELRPYAESSLDLGAVATRILELFRARPDFLKGMKLPAERHSALLTGEAGIVLTAYRVAPSPELAADLHALVRANVDNEAEELMWGSPGTLVAARRMLEWTRDERWCTAWNESADRLLARRDEDGMWTQRLYGQVHRGLNTAHGLVGNVQALVPLLDKKRRAELTSTSNGILARTAFREDDFANWAYFDRPRLAAQDGTVRLQWCAGAPGIVAAAGSYLHEDLLLAGTGLTWHAGPPGMDKGPGICHGTAGQGFAFLKVFERTDDERWLDRARRFAVHALEQVERRGEGRYSLWTGDLGVALYAVACLEGRASYPVLE